MSRAGLTAAFALAMAALASAATPATVPLAAQTRLAPHEATICHQRYRGVASLTVEPQSPLSGDGLVVLPCPIFHDGSIELQVAGEVLPGADAGARGFVGVAFRVDPAVNHYEAFYLRPTNGRAEDQLRRNHALQYVSEPDWPWMRLRKETPGQYEAYADLVAAAWTRVRIEVKGTTARLFVNGAAQPSLIVRDLKRGDVAGAIALWVGPGTRGHFTDPRILYR